jgi:hypothetical protein
VADGLDDEGSFGLVTDPSGGTGAAQGTVRMSGALPMRDVLVGASSIEWPVL